MDVCEGVMNELSSLISGLRCLQFPLQPFRYPPFIWVWVVGAADSEMSRQSSSSSSSSSRRILECSQSSGDIYSLQGFLPATSPGRLPVKPKPPPPAPLSPEERWLYFELLPDVWATHPIPDTALTLQIQISFVFKLWNLSQQKYN